MGRALVAGGGKGGEGTVRGGALEAKASVSRRTPVTLVSSWAV